jgi:hypothetical protein
MALSSSDDNDDDDDECVYSPPTSKRRKSSSGKQIPVEQDNNEGRDEEDEEDEGAVPTAMFTQYSGGYHVVSDPPLRAQHRAQFVQRAFQSVDKDDSLAGELSDDMQKDRMSSLHPESELEEICFVLKHWGVDVNLKAVKDDKLRKKLSLFCRRNKHGKHWVENFIMTQSPYQAVKGATLFDGLRRIKLEELLCLRREFSMQFTSGIVVGKAILEQSKLGQNTAPSIGTALNI